MLMGHTDDVLHERLVGYLRSLATRAEDVRRKTAIPGVDSTSGRTWLATFDNYDLIFR